MKKSLSTRYVALLDWWVALLAVLGIGMLVSSIPLIIWRGDLSLSTTIFVVLVLIACVLLLVDRIFFTAYVLEPNGLYIYGQIRRVFIPYTSIDKVTNGTVFDLFSTNSRKRFALSKDCLILHVKGGDWQRISISPKERGSFLDQLLTHLNTEKKGKRYLYQPKSKPKKRRASR